MTRAADLRANLAAVQRRIDEACAAAGRHRDDVALIVVSKTWPVADLEILLQEGVRDFGENRLPELQEKAAALSGHDVRWHFIGQIQSKKATAVGRLADVVHCVDRTKLLTPLAVGAQATGRTPDVLLQVSLDGDVTRGGALPAQVPALADATATTPGLHLAGIMCLPPRSMAPAEAFARIGEVSADLRRTHPSATAISAGMSHDLAAAVTAGATLLRIGTAVFGERETVR